MAESDVRVFRPNSEPAIGCLFLSFFGLVGLGIGAYALVTKLPAVRLDSMLPTVIGIAAISLAFRMYYTAKYQKIEATERGIVIYSYRNRPSLDVNWADVSEYYRKPGVGPDGLGNPKPISNCQTAMVDSGERKEDSATGSGKARRVPKADLLAPPG